MLLVSPSTIDALSIAQCDRRQDICGQTFKKIQDPDCKLKGKWQQKFLSSYLKETPKQYIEVYYRIVYLPYFLRYFDLKSLVVRHLGYF